MNKLLTIVGPTGSGKSALALKLAKKYKGEIICADSRTVYRYMDIGTAKPTKAEMLLIPHHLVNVVEPFERFSAADFKLKAVGLIEEISARGKLPIMVGGTGLYIDALLYDYQFPPESDPKLRAELDRMSDADLMSRLEQANPDAAELVDVANRRRVIRAIETAGHRRSKSQALRPGSLELGMALNKKEIQQRIEERAKKMLKLGLIEEVRRIGERYGWDAPGLSAPAYKAFKEVVLGEKSEAEGLAEFVKRDINLAKRQMTWFKRHKEIIWLEAEEPQSLLDEADKLVTRFLAG